MPDNTNRPKDPPEVNVPYTLEEIRGGILRRDERVIIQRPDGVPFYHTERGLIPPPMPERFERVSGLAFRSDAFRLVNDAPMGRLMVCKKCGEEGHSWCGVVRINPPLAGHAGDCEKVLHATVSGKTDAPCSCGASK